MYRFISTPLDAIKKKEKYLNDTFPCNFLNFNSLIIIHKKNLIIIFFILKHVYIV
jgi:hypothetical protein